MVRSMTGFGKASRVLDGAMISVELSSVNHRYLDSSLRLPNEWAALDPVIRDCVKERVARGKISLTVSRKRGTSTAQTLKFDAEVAKQYVQASQALNEMLGTSDALKLNTLAQFDGVFFHEENGQDLDEARAVLIETVNEALGHLDEMRTTEGKALAGDLSQRIGLLRAWLGNIEERLPALADSFRERLKTRVQELSEDVGLTEDRLAIEVALMAEKGDVTEEVVRLESHFDHALEMLKADEPVGRKLNFLAQEMQREINTLSAKVRDTEVARIVLDMKSELEKIREQIQNIE